jgi:hypothetical protein
MIPTNTQNINFKYFVILLHKNGKCVALSMYIFKSLMSTKFYYFCVAHNAKNFSLKIDMLACYIIDYVQIF